VANLTFHNVSFNFATAVGLHLLTPELQEEVKEKRRVSLVRYLRYLRLGTNTPPRFHVAEPNGIGKKWEMDEETQRND
jgi:hypothetical protein